MATDDPTPQPDPAPTDVDFSPLDTPEARDQLLADVQSHRFRNEDPT